ncbi:homocitrate synthase [Clostridium sp. E02]|uniref:LeuA family protein n=1 Tax=Clostridium sp. E02 TaxID=2487134 RepID=UPI000F54101E|nr:homocitrate synthase [Clostridium sp. E02]
MKRRIKLVDTTLRDGEQCPGVVFSPSDKIKLALYLDRIGVSEIEAGFYDTSTEGFYTIREIMRQRKQAEISVWSRLNPQNVEESARQRPDRIHVGTPVSYAQIYNKIGKNKKWIEKTLLQCIKVAKDYNIPLTVGLEDASRADVAFLVSLIRLMKREGVEVIRLADTVGVLFPKRARELVEEIRQTGIQIEVHEHNDFGMAVANSMVMALAGSDMVDATLLGIGERAGNCNLYEFVHGANRKFDMGVSSLDVKKAEEQLQSMMRGAGTDDTQN